MKVRLQNGQVQTSYKFNIRGLRISEIRLDLPAVNELLNMHHEDIINTLLLMKHTMWVPPAKGLRIQGMPVDVENFERMQRGENYEFHEKD